MTENYARFQRALLTKNVALVTAAARELPHVELRDAMRILTVYARARDPRYDAAAVRFLARLASERRIDLSQLRRAHDVLAGLPRDPDSAIALQDLVDD